MEQEYIDIIWRKLSYSPKYQLEDYIIDKGLSTNQKIDKSEAVKLIYEHCNGDKDILNEIIDRFERPVGLIATEVENMLGISQKERIKWTHKGLLKIVGSYEKKIDNMKIDCFLYDIRKMSSITKEEINQWRAEEKPLTDKQKDGIEKAKRTKLRKRTCKGCGEVVKKPYYLYYGLCQQCESRLAACVERRKWLASKGKYVILDVETTGFGDDDEIIEIAVINLNGEVLINTLVLPNNGIKPESTDLHGIDMSMLKNSEAPSWTEVYPKLRDILRNKTMLSYDSEFDKRQIKQSCKASGISFEDIDHECIMHNVMGEEDLGYRYRVNLQRAAGVSGDLRALGNCMLCLKIINNCDFIMHGVD